MTARALSTTAAMDAARRGGSSTSLGVGAGDVAALVLPDYRYGDPWTLFMRKTGRHRRSEPTEAMEWGLRLEDALFPKRQEEAGPDRLVIAAHRIYGNDHSPGLICSPDLLEVPASAGEQFDLDAPAAHGLEATDTKVTSTRTFDEQWTDGPPAAAYLQVTAQCRVLDARVGRLCVFVPDWPRPKWHTVEWEYDPELGEMIAAAADLFWQGVIADRAPTFTARSKATQEALNEAWVPEDRGDPVELSPVALAAAEEKLRLTAEKTALEKRVDELDALVKVEMGPACLGLAPDGREAVTWSWSDRADISVKDMRRDHPDLYRQVEAAGLLKVDPVRRLTVKKPKAEKAPPRPRTRKKTVEPMEV